MRKRRAATGAGRAMLSGAVCAAVVLASPLSLGAQQSSTTEAALIQEAGQGVVVVVDEADRTTGRLLRYEAGADGWRAVGEPVAVVVGRSGVGPKREGDGRSPQGVFSLGSAFGYGEAPPAGVRLPYRGLGPGTRCVDDPESRHYNRLVEVDHVEVDWNSAERMRRDLAYGDDLYALGIEVAYNTEPVPGDGSCIFLHIWRSSESPTAGCTAMSRGDLLALMRWLDPDLDPILIQGSRSHLEALQQRGLLPDMPDLAL